MISAWWLIPICLGCVYFGVFIAALLSANEGGEDDAD